MFSPTTHNTFYAYNLSQVIGIRVLLRRLLKHAEKGGKTAYTKATFIEDVTTALEMIDDLLEAGNALTKVPASILFLIFVGCNSARISIDMHIPHIIRIEEGNNAGCYVVTKEEWVAHRKADQAENTPIEVSDHAKLRFLERALGLKLDMLMKAFPHEELDKSTQWEELSDGRKRCRINGLSYILDGRTCISVLESQMFTK